MSSSFKEKVVCPRCGSVHETTIYTSVNVTIDPSLREPFLSKKINWVRCSKCNTDIFIPVEFTYHDMNKQFLVIFKPPGVTDSKTEDTFNDFSNRFALKNYFSFPVIVRDPYELIFAVSFCDETAAPKSKEDAARVALRAKESIKKMGLTLPVNKGSAPTSNSQKPLNKQNTISAPETMGSPKRRLLSFLRVVLTKRPEFIIYTGVALVALRLIFPLRKDWPGTIAQAVAVLLLAGILYHRAVKVGQK